jgi:coenzyme F420H2 oxidase
MLMVAGNTMKADAAKITDGFYWVGVLDWDIRSYHGTTHNAYLIFGEGRIAFIDNAYPGASTQMAT